VCLLSNDDDDGDGGGYVGVGGSDDNVGCIFLLTDTAVINCIIAVLLVELWFVIDLSDVDADDADNVDIVICVHCRVTNRDEDLFNGNMAPGLSPSDPPTVKQASFCLCDRPHGTDPASVNRTAVCDRRAVSDTTADASEPRRNVRLGVPKAIVEKRRRRKRQTSGRRANMLTGSRRIYQTDYEYVSQKIAKLPVNLKTTGPADFTGAVLHVNVC